MKDSALLDKMYEQNLAYFKELTMYILAGKQKLQEVRGGKLMELEHKAQQSGLAEDAQAARDLADKLARFEKKIHDLELTRAISIQTAPQIRMIQNNDNVMVEKIQTTLVNTIPLWKNQMVLALGIAHSTEAAQAQRQVTDITNALLKQNAEKLRMNAVILSCESLEVYVAAAQKAAGTAYPVVWLKQKYHDDPAAMRLHILDAIASLPEEVDTVLVAMGFCGGSWESVTAGRTIVVPRVDDCISLLLHTDDRFADMVRYAKASPKVQRVDTTTNASLLTPERSLEIIDAGLDRINISVEGVNSDQYWDFSGHKMDYQQFVDNIAFFYDHKKQCEMNIKINGDILTLEEEAEFYRTFGNITDGINVERTIEYWPKYNEMKVEFDEGVSLLGGAAREVQVCPYVFYEMCINANGTYSLCRFDWNHAMLLDPHVSYPPTPKKIWDSITLWNFQQQFLRKERKLMTVLSCPKCGILKQGVPEDLDEFAEEILDEM